MHHDEDFNPFAGAGTVAQPTNTVPNSSVMYQPNPVQMSMYPPQAMLFANPQPQFVFPQSGMFANIISFNI